jgi:ribonuclease P protein component
VVERSRADHPREARVRRRREFQVIQKEGIRVHTAAFTVIARGGGGSRPRLGLAVSRRVGNAVVRNRVRRLVKELFRRWARGVEELIDVVVVAKGPAAGLAAAGYAAVVADLGPGLDRARKRIRPARRDG